MTLISIPRATVARCSRPLPYLAYARFASSALKTNINANETSKSTVETIAFPSAGSYKTVTVERVAACNRVAVLTFNRPHKKNAFNYTMYEEVSTVLRKLSNSTEIEVICLTGAGDFYSAGNDLANFSQLKHPLAIASHARGVCEKFVDSFIDCERPLVAAVNGPAVGIGATSLVLMDVVIMAEGSYLSTPFTALGQAPEGKNGFFRTRIRI